MSEPSAHLHPTPPANRRRWHRLAPALVGLTLAVGLATVPAARADATAPVRPVIIVGGHGTTHANLQPMVNGFIGATPSYPAYSFELSRCTSAALFPCTGAPSTLNYPGTGSNIDSAFRLATKVDQVLAETGASQVELVGISQGILPIRAYVQALGGAPKVAGVFSYFGVNKGISSVGTNWFGAIIATFLTYYCNTYSLQVCQEMVYPGTVPGNPATGPGATSFLQSLNSGDVTPGTITFYHLYTESEEPPGEGERALIPDFTNISAQSLCTGTVAHGAIYKPVMLDMLSSAIRRDGVHSDCV